MRWKLNLLEYFKAIILSATTPLNSDDLCIETARLGARTLNLVWVAGSSVHVDADSITELGKAGGCEWVGIIGWAIHQERSLLVRHGEVENEAGG